MRRELFIIGTLLALACAPFANAQENILELQKSLSLEEQETHSSKTPPDTIADYLHNRAHDLPVHGGDLKNLYGAWSITTQRNSARCSLNGVAHISRPEPDTYSCELIMRDYCQNRHDGIIRQSCEVEVSNDVLTISATVVEALNGATLRGYSPDDFILEPQKDGTLKGHHEGFGGYPATWQRSMDVIS